MPVHSLNPSADYHTVAQPNRATWTAGDVTAINVNGAQGRSRACTNEGGAFLPLSGTDFLGRRAFGETPRFFSTGSQALSLNATNTTATKTETVNVQIGLAPIITAGVDQTYSTSASVWKPLERV